MSDDEGHGGLAYRWAAALIDQLVTSGVTLFFIAPGSRSTPLTMAAARHGGARTVVHFDERGTCFMAVGAARATGRPAAWITTSGTAVANGFPAVVEASIDHIPVILLTADRPPELRHTGANQTVDQAKIFGEQVRWFFD
ncbi:MAG: thiamine pyrophosphate-binding protein, partial [Bacteroidota bacterium]